MAENTGREFKGYPKQAIGFFRGIKQNNNKQWFEAHKQDYINYCVKPTWGLIHDLSGPALNIDPYFQTDPHKIISRIYRDIRFSKDKSPYKSRLWFSFKRPGVEWQDAPGYYFEVAHDSYGFGMGMYDPSKETIRKFKAAIAAKPAGFLKAISFFGSKPNIFSVGGASYKRPPKEEVDKKILRWYMMKSFYFYCAYRPVDSLLFSPKLAYCGKGF